MNKQIKATILSAIVVLGSTTGLWANSTVLTAGTGAQPVVSINNGPGTQLAVDYSTFSSLDENGYVWEYVLSNFADNPWDSSGGLTFVYQIYNSGTSKDAISGLSINGWDGFKVAVAQWQYNAGVFANDAYRAVNNDTVGFNFSIGLGQVLPGANSTQLVIYSDATSYTKINSGIKDGSGANVMLFTANLPDGGTTALMFGLGLLGLGLAARRNKRA